MKKTLLLFLFVLLFGSFKVSGQGHEYAPPIPTSPDAAALAKFSQTPVSYNTGVPNISIPIYELEVRGLKVPIALNYHAGGIRVDEVASNVGLGWALSAGGVISSTVLDKPDLGVDGYASGVYFPQDRILDPANDIDDYRLCMQLSGAPSAGSDSKVSMSSADLQPDVFSYSLPGRSGKYVYTQQKEARTVPYEPILIQDNPQGAGIMIMDEKGIKYTFSNIEEIRTGFTVVEGGSNLGAYQPISHVYHLSKIETPEGDYVQLEYEDVTYSYKSLGTHTRHLADPSQPCTAPPDSRTEGISFVSGKRLKKIVSSKQEEITFEYGFPRKDLPGTNSLKRIKIREAGKSAADPKHEFVLSYSYFQSHGSSGIEDDSLATSIPSDNLRLKLDSVQEQGKPAYRVTYNEQQALPPRLTPSQDHWGYYNGSMGLLPRDIGWGFNTGGSREPSEALMKAWIIERLYYPTGGYTLYRFDPHDYYSSGTRTKEFPRSEAYYTYQGRDGVSIYDMYRKVIRFTVGENGPITPNGVTAYYYNLSGNTALDYHFSAELKGVGHSFHKIFMGSSPSSTGEVFTLYAGEYELIIEWQGAIAAEEGAGISLHWSELGQELVENNPIAGGLRIAETVDHGLEGKPLHRKFIYRERALSDVSSGRLLFQPQYSYETFVAAPDNPDSPPLNPYCVYRSQNSSSFLPLTALAGSSVAYTSVFVLSGEEEGNQTLSGYCYSFENDLNGSYSPPFTPATSYEWRRGLLLEEVDYLYDPAYTGDLGMGQFRPHRRVEYFYSNHFTAPDIRPPGPDETGYQFINPDKPNEARVLGMQLVVVQNERDPIRYPGNYRTVFDIQYFHHLSVWQHLIRKDETLYDSKDADTFIRTTTKYYHDNPAHAQLTRTEQIDSEGHWRTSRLTYPGDYLAAPVGATAEEEVLGLKALQNKHMIATNIERQEWLQRGSEQQLLASSMALYKPWSGHPVMSRITSVDLENPISHTDFTQTSVNQQGELVMDPRYRETMRFTKYSPSYNPLEFKKQSQLTALIWDEQKLKVLAEIKAASTDQVAFTSFEGPHQQGGWTFTAGTVSESGRTGRFAYFSPNSSISSRSGLPAGTYILSFWSKGTGEVAVNAQSPIIQDSDDWQLQTILLADPDQVVITPRGGIQLDDLRLFPAGAQMTSYTYEPMKGVTSVTDAANKSTIYEYDSLGRLKTVKNDRKEVLKSYEYHYKEQAQ